MKTGALKTVQLDKDWSVQTILPIELDGRELLLETHAYQGDAPEEQALVLIHRAEGAQSKNAAEGAQSKNAAEGAQSKNAAEGAAADTVPVVRVHSGCVTGDIFHSLRCDCYQQLQSALKTISSVPLGVIIYVPYHEGRGIGLFKKIQAYALQDQGFDTVEANIEVGAPIDGRDYELAARILLELGMPTIKLLSNNPAKEQALKALGIRVEERLGIVTKPNPYNKRYLETKRARMAHKI